jgi:ankyrin repeat domain-containing protein 42
MACAHGNSFVVHTLLRGGAVRFFFSLLRILLSIYNLLFKDINHQDNNGWIPAFTAAYHGRLGCLQILVKWGAKLDDVDNEGNTAGKREKKKFG